MTNTSRLHGIASTGHSSFFLTDCYRGPPVLAKIQSKINPCDLLRLLKMIRQNHSSFAVLKKLLAYDYTGRYGVSRKSFWAFHVAFLFLIFFVFRKPLITTQVWRGNTKNKEKVVRAKKLSAYDPQDTIEYYNWGAGLSLIKNAYMFYHYLSLLLSSCC